jgi:hypothetical protein
MQYQVPQFIETEDKVVGPFSLRQFAYVGVAALISAGAYFFLQTWLFLIIALVLVGGSLALSFVKINGRPLIKVATAAFYYYWKPQLYVWKPDHPMIAQQPHAPATARKLLPVADSAPEGFLHKIWGSSQHAPAAVRALPPIAAIASGDSLHKSWGNLQTGTPETKEMSDRQFLEKKMMERYQIFRRLSGDRAAARRVDYR